MFGQKVATFESKSIFMSKGWSGVEKQLEIVSGHGSKKAKRGTAIQRRVG